MDQVFQSAIRARKARIVCLGARLRPLTVGHLFVLHELGNAYPENEAHAQWEDVVTAVLVCSQKTAKKARRMLHSCFSSIGLALWGIMNREPDREAFERRKVIEKALFESWLRHQLKTPQRDALSFGSGAAEEQRVPLCWRLLAMLMADFGMTREKALQQEVSFALVLWATEADRRGVCKLASERQIRFRSWVERMERARLAAKENAEGGNPS